MVKKLTEQYIIGFFSGLFAGLVVLAAQMFIPINSFEKVGYFLGFILLFFVIGIVCVELIIPKLK